MTRSRAVAYLIMHRKISKDIDGMRLIDADMQMQTLEAMERLMLDVRAGRKSQFSVSFPEEIDVFISDP